MSKLQEDGRTRHGDSRKRRGNNEGHDFQDRRHNRINFKNYLRQLEEDQLSEDVDLEELREDLADDVTVEDDK